jgi:hypothetical protein
VKRDHEEVCPISRGVIFQSLSPRLQRGVRFFLNPLPAAPTVFLAVHLPFPAVLRAYPVPHVFLSGADPSFFAGGTLSMMTHSQRAIPDRLPFWFKPISTFGLSCITTFNRGSRYVDRTRSSLAPLRLCAGRFHLPSRVGVPNYSVVTLSPELHTEPLPAPHVQVENS